MKKMVSKAAAKRAIVNQGRMYGRVILGVYVTNYDKPRITTVKRVGGVVVVKQEHKPLTGKCVNQYFQELLADNPNAYVNTNVHIKGIVDSLRYENKHSKDFERLFGVSIEGVDLVSMWQGLGRWLQDERAGLPDDGELQCEIINKSYYIDDKYSVQLDNNINKKATALALTFA